MYGYTMTPDECKRSYAYPGNQKNYATLEAFAEACGVDLNATPPAQADTPPPAPPPPRARKADAPRARQAPPLPGVPRRPTAPHPTPAAPPAPPPAPAAEDPRIIRYQVMRDSYRKQGYSRADAIKRVVDFNPDIHRDYVEAINGA